MKTKIQIKSIFGKIIFEYEKENNTIKDAVVKAVSEGLNLRYANLSDAYLRGADLRGANLRGSDLRFANLRGSDLRGSDLIDADLIDADLSDADLSDADLRGANLRFANLSNANLNNYKHQIWIIPEEGSFIAWKKCVGGAIVKLEIPSDAKRTCNFINRKCRAEFVKVIEVYDLNGKEIELGIAAHDMKTEYRKGEIVRPDKYDDDLRNDCTNGIHFFVTRKEAELW
jgi:hypothetical protein